MHPFLRKSITTLAFVLAAGGASAVLAQAPKTPIALKPEAPDRYTVVRGDTLWSIAERYTDSPWRWPELWNLNKDQIKNPHRIYPGDVIVLDRARQQLAISSDTVRLSPRVRAESTARAAIPSIPARVIEPFLTRPLVVEPDGLAKAPTIVATEEGRVVVGAGNHAFVKGLGGSGEQDWMLYRQGKALVDPDSKNTLGYEAIYLGTARIVRAGEPAMIAVTTAQQEIGVGDKLVPAGKAEIVSYAPHAPSTAVKGRVISLYGSGGRTSEAGPQSVITVNLGRAQGLEVGHVLALARPGEAIAQASRVKNAGDLKIPDERYGLAFVFRVFENVSYALVMHITRPVNILDIVQNP